MRALGGEPGIPRVALAWKPQQKGRFSKVMIRASYAWFYNPSQYNQFENLLAAQPPFAVSNDITTSSTNVLTLANARAPSWLISSEQIGPNERCVAKRDS